jgi:hypothetical protein
MIYPTICVDNFFNEPDKILEFSNSLNFFEDTEGRWPGKRTSLLHEINFDFFEQFGLKVLSILYPTIKKITFKCSLNFQKISEEYINKGWIHRDSETSDFTCIVYLSKHKECGTSIFNSKKLGYSIKNTDQKKDIYKTKQFEKELIFLEENNSQFEENIIIKSRFNRLIIFDSNQLHGAQKFIEQNLKESRLTLVGFFSNIYFDGIKFNGIQHKSIL